MKIKVRGGREEQLLKTAVNLRALRLKRSGSSAGRHSLSLFLRKFYITFVYHSSYVSLQPADSKRRITFTAAFPSFSLDFVALLSPALALVAMSSTARFVTRILFYII